MYFDWTSVSFMVYLLKFCSYG